MQQPGSYNGCRQVLKYPDLRQRHLYRRRGTHLSGFRSGLTRTINDYGRTAGLLKDKEENLSGEDVREGLTAIVSIKVKEAQFEGQTKTKLGNSEVKGIVDNIVSDGLKEFFEEHPGEAKSIVNKAISAARARQAARHARDLTRRKMPGNQQPARETGRLLGKERRYDGNLPGRRRFGRRLGKQGRDRKFQAILPPAARSSTSKRPVWTRSWPMKKSAP